MKRIVSLILTIIISIQLTARSSSDVRSLFIYQFTKLIEWPKDAQSGMFRIGVIGSFEAYKDIMDIAMGRNVGNQNIEVMNIMSISQIPLSEFHILLIGEDLCNPEAIQKINKVLTSKSTLVIAQKMNYTGNDVCIRFEGNNTDFTYTYMYTEIQQKHLKCSQDFLLLGKKEN